MNSRNGLTIAAGLFTALLGLLLALEGAWLTWVGGTPAYLISGIGYLIVGAFVIARRGVGFWLNLLVFVAALVWSFWETGFHQMTVFTALPRLDVPMLIAIILMVPWIWRGIGSAAFPALMSGIGALALLAIGIGVMISMPWVEHPNGRQMADNGPRVTLPKTKIKPGNWPDWGRTPGQSRYSPLDQINTQNVSQIKQAWSYQSGDMKHAHDAAPHWGDEATPIKIGNRLYTCTPNAWVVALNPATGKQIWKFKPKGVDDSDNNFVNCRGVSYYAAPVGYTASDGSQTCKTRIIAPTMGPYIVALDAKTGKKCPGFGTHNGMIDLTDHMGGVAPGALVQSADPLVMDGLIYTGGNVMDNWYLGEPSGVIRAWSATTGKEVWHWDLGKKNPNAPLTAGEIYTKHTPNAWGQITGDPNNNMIIVPLGNSTPDYYGKNRGKKLMHYSGSLVALNARTGKEIWHFQEAHTDVWDYDIPVGPTLVNWPNGHGSHTPALVSTNKRGVLFVLNRKTGKPIMPVKQEPMPTGPKGGVLTDWMSKTQPYSPDMPQLRPAKLKATDMWGATPFGQMWCRARFNQMYYPGNSAPPTLQGTLMYPTFDGVTDWYGASFGPHGQLNIVANYLPFVGQLIPRKDAAGKGLIKQWNGKGVPPLFKGEGRYKPQYGLPYAIDLHPFLSPISMPCNAPPWATLNQINLATHKIEWSVPLGNSRHTAPFNIKQDVPLPTSVPELGSGVMTAGGVTFIAGTADDMLRAYDTNTGKVLWSTYLPAGAQANPAIYKANGREYVVITAGGHQPLGTIRGDYTIAFALPEKVASDGVSP